MASKPASAVVNVGAPNQSLYCTNLPDKLKKPDLRLALYTLFSTYGTVLDVVAMKTAKMRGQAHVVFKDIQASTQAMRALQGFEFFGKEMKIVYAKGSSDIIAKLRGTYNAPATAPVPGVSTELQKSIFNAPPSAVIASTTAPPTAGEMRPTSEGPQGVKRPREEEESEGEAPMEEESDVSMEASSDED
ncbi:U2 snRNP complex subunit msl1 [Onygenales sp. PD_40]|nr:U2 snRNP complex subunit msl1 [Onygenales sp. PD_40]KAK2783921.1 U2 snRNP complex subunit msl1 [Onygenales sp. PD_12]KAK2788282.1 U2 snRNP complex subunit msl1 [Emmonsiellopsis sp. PD_33]